jgi:iron complex outermembrane recepter protein
LQADGSSDVNVPTAGFPQTAGLGDLEQNYVPGIGGQETSVEAYSAVVKARFGSVDLTSLSGYNVYDSPSSFDWSSSFGASVASRWGVTGAPFFDLSRYTKLVQELRFSSSIGANVDWQLAGFYSHTKLRGYEYLLAADATTGEQLGKHWILTYPRTYREAAVFANVTYRFTERFDIQVGGRQGQNEEEQEAFVQEGMFIEDTRGVPRVAAAEVSSKSDTFTYLVTPRFRFSPDLMAYARFASGFRPGGPNSSDPNIPASYDADKTQNYELGLKGDFFDRAVSLDASIYYIDWKNIQIQRFSSTNLSYTSNGSGAKSEGVELAATWRPARGTTLSGWYAFNKAELTEAFPTDSPLYGVPGDRLPQSSRHSGSLSVDQQFSLGGALEGFAGVTANFVGDRVGVFQGFAANGEPLPRQQLSSYANVDLRIGIRNPAWTASWYVNNLADERGVINGGLGDTLPFSFQYIRPRTMGLSITREF